MIYTKETRKIVEDFLDAIDLEIERINTILLGDSEDVNLTEKLNMLDDKIELIRIEHEMRLVLFNTRTHQ